MLNHLTCTKLTVKKLFYCQCRINMEGKNRQDKIGAVDTSIILEPLLAKRKKGETCITTCYAIQKFQHEFPFKLTIPASVICEMAMVINKKILFTKMKQEDLSSAENTMHEFLEKCQILPIKKESIILANQILSEDDRLDPMDVMHFAVACTNGCEHILFLSDKKLSESDIIKEKAKEFNINLLYLVNHLKYKD